MTLGSIKSTYVVWIDIMGSGILMRTSVSLARRAVEFLHSSVEESLSDDIQAFPMNDGVFLSGGDFRNLERCIKRIYRRIYDYDHSIYSPHTTEKQPSEQLRTLALDEARKLILVRACIAYGPTTTSRSSSNAEIESGYGHVILGPAVANAYAGESLAGPFGIFVHESARMHGSRRYRAVFLRFSSFDDDLSSAIKSLLTKYFDFAKDYPYELSYKPERQREHRALCREYFKDPEL